MINPDYIQPELYDRRDVLWLQKKQRVDYARSELQRLEMAKSHDRTAIALWADELIIRLAELHLVTTL